MCRFLLIDYLRAAIPLARSILGYSLYAPGTLKLIQRVLRLNDFR